MARRLEKITLKLDKAAAEFAIDRRTLERGLAENNEASDENDCFTILQCHRAAAGDLEAQKIRETRHRANLLEMEEQERRGDLIEVVRVKSVLEKILVALRAGILASHLLAEEKDELLKTLQPLAGDAWKSQDET